jgi:hypothetical protein
MERISNGGKKNHIMKNYREVVIRTLNKRSRPQTRIRLVARSCKLKNRKFREKIKRDAVWLVKPRRQIKRRAGSA